MGQRRLVIRSHAHPVCLTCWLARTTLSGFGSWFLTESLRDPDRCELPGANLFPSRNTSEPVQRLRVERDRKRFRRRPPQSYVNGFAFVEKLREIFVAETIPFNGLFAKCPPLCRCHFLRHC